MALILNGCPKCGGTLSPDDEYDDEQGGKIIEYACVSCGKRMYRRVRGNEQTKRRDYS